ncbi:hypothetical protein Bbelb_274590 [Branchiostoma belcheri]|nr:hypothetical protein Bbelb_274590 [Branchiostoma belcheri]
MEKFLMLVAALFVAMLMVFGTELNPCRPPPDVRVCGCWEGVFSTGDICTVCACAPEDNTWECFVNRYFWLDIDDDWVEGFSGQSVCINNNCVSTEEREANAFDDDVGTFWEPLYEPFGYAHWVILNLQQVWRIYRFGIINYGDIVHDVKSFLLESSPSNPYVWGFANSSDGVQAGIPSLQTFDVYVQTQYLKITVNTSSGEQPKVREFALYVTENPPLAEPCVVVHTGCVLDEPAVKIAPPGDQQCYVIADIHELIRDKNNPLLVHRTGNITFHGDLSVECPEDVSYNISLYWTVREEGPVTSGPPLDDILPEDWPQNNLHFSVPPRTLPLGLYMIQFQATLTVPGSGHVSIAAVQTWVEVTRMPLVFTVGPVQQTVNTTFDLIVNAALSYDPDGILSSSGFLYDWKCSYEATLPLDASKVNIAVCKESFSSGVAYGGVPENGNDGENGDGNYNSESCIHSGGEANPWWMVDLGKQYPIERIIVYVRRDWEAEIDSAKIHVGDFPVLLDNPIVETIQYVAERFAYYINVGGTLARYAGISDSVSGDGLGMGICEFEVYTNEAALLPGTDCEVVLGCVVESRLTGIRTFTTSLITYDRPPGIIAHVSVNVTAGTFPTASLQQTIHVVLDESLLGLYLECKENCNQFSTAAGWPLVLDTASEIQGSIEYSLVEYPAEHVAENWTSVIEVVNASLRVPEGVFVDVGYYTIRLTDTVDGWQKTSEWRFQVLPGPFPSSTADGDPLDLSGMCTLIPAAEFADLFGPLETQVAFELDPLAEIATVTYPGDGEPTLNEVILNPFTGWVGFTNLFDLPPGTVILQIALPTIEQLQEYLDGFLTYPTGGFFSLIQNGEPLTAFLGAVIASHTASVVAAGGVDITEKVDMMIAELSRMDIPDMETVNSASVSVLMLTAIPEMVSGKTQVLSADLLYECFETTRELSTNVTKMPTWEVNKAAARMNQEATEVGFKALDVLDEIYLINRMKGDPNREMFFDVAMSTVQIRIQRERQNDPSEKVYTVGGTGGRSNSLVRVSSFSSLLGGACPGDTVGVQFLESNFNPFEYSNNSRIIRADVTGLHVKCGNVEIPVSGLSQPVDILTNRKNGSLKDSLYTFQASEGLGSLSFFTKKKQSALSFSLDFNSTLFSQGITLFLRKEAPPTPEDYNWTSTLPVPDAQIVSIPWINETVLTSNPYHWLLSPEEIDITDDDVENKTNYFLGVRFGPAQNLSSGDIVDFTLHIFETSCVYFDEDVDLWHGDGCTVGMMSNASHIHCQCDHLTKFSGFVTPNPLNIAAALSANVLENPAGLILVLTVLGMYFMGVLWARKEDRRDLAKVGVKILPGHRLNPKKDCQYVITVYTGFKGNAGTTAEVTIVLYGQDRESLPFILSDSKRVTFEKGSVDSFLVSTSEPLGDLTYLRVWHNNAGYSPAWFLNQIVVTDRGNNRPHFFLCNRWFATDKDDGKVYRLLPESGPDEMKEFRNVFLAKSSRDMNDGHLWFSVAGRPARSPFTRVQRLSCCLTLLYSTMLTNIMFFGRGDDFDPPEPLRIAGTEINSPISLPQIMIGLQSAAIILPVNLLIVFLFRNSGSRSAKKRAKSTNKVPHQNLTNYLPQTKAADETRTVVLYDTGVDTPSFWHREENDAKMNTGYHTGPPRYAEQTGPFSDNTAKRNTDQEDEETGTSTIPWWAVYLGWLLVWSASFAAAFFTVLYSLSFGRAKAEAWLLTFLTSFLTDLFLVQPFKLLLVAMLFALLVKKPVEDEDPQPAPLQLDEEYLQDNTRTSEGTHPNSPPEESALTEQRAQSTQKRRRRKQIVEVLMFGLFLTVVMLTSYTERSPLAFYVTENVQGLILDNGDISFPEIEDIPSFWTWVTTGLIPATHVSRRYNGWSVTETMVLDDMLTHPLGPVQLRQVRLKPGKHCTPPERMTTVTPRCADMYSLDLADTQNYRERWNTTTNTTGNAFCLSVFPMPNTTESPEFYDCDDQQDPWSYTFASVTDAFPYFGVRGTYSAGGYVTSLGRTEQISLARAAYLQRQDWLDDKTRAVFIELTLYNPHVNLFSVVSMAVEFTNLGAIYKGSEVVTLRLIQRDAILLLALRGVFALLVLVYALKEGKALFSRPLDYLSEFWSWVELLVIAVGFSALGVYFYTQSIIDKVAVQRAAGNSTFEGYKSAVSWYQVYTYLLGLLICCSTFKFVRILRFNSHVNALSMTLRRSLKPVTQFMFTAGIVIMAFTQTASLIFGVKLMDKVKGASKPTSREKKSAPRRDRRDMLAQMDQVVVELDTYDNFKPL